MNAPTVDSDPTGLAAIVIAMITPTITVLALTLGWTTELSGNVTLAFAALVNGAVGIWAVLQARKHAYAPDTVERIKMVAERPQRDDTPPHGV